MAGPDIVNNILMMQSAENPKVRATIDTRMLLLAQLTLLKDEGWDVAKLDLA
jgi:hypothetical protein